MPCGREGIAGCAAEDRVKGTFVKWRQKSLLKEEWEVVGGPVSVMTDVDNVNVEGIPTNLAED